MYTNLKLIADRYIPAPENKEVLINKNGGTRDIIKEVLECYAYSKDQLKKFAPYLRGATTLETCRNIWTFWKENIRYQVDPKGKQWIKTPAAVWASKYCDCKSFSVAVASTLHALGIDGAFRFASYDDNKIAPTHVYVTARDERGKEIIIDCVWILFNSEKTYAKKWDYNMSTAARINGVQITDKTAIVFPIDGTGDEVSGIFAKIGLAPARGAFLAMIRLNLHGTATHLFNRIKNDGETKLAASWKKMGGNFNKLRAAILKGSKHREFLNKKIQGVGATGGGDAHSSRGTSTPVEHESSKDRETGHSNAVTQKKVSLILSIALPVIQALKDFFPAKAKDQISKAQEAIKTISAAGGITTNDGVNIPDSYGNSGTFMDNPINADTGNESIDESSGSGSGLLLLGLGVFAVMAISKK